jgi:cell division protein FtsW
MPQNDMGSRKRRQPLKRRKKARKSHYYDYNLLAIVVLLTCFGLIMLYSTSAYISQLKYGTDLYYFKKQAVISVVFLIGAFFLSQIDYRILTRLATFVYVVSLGFLCLVPIIGREANGAKRWIYIGPLSFQPSELAKLAVIVFLPFLIVKIGKNIKGWKAPAMVGAAGFLLAGFTYLLTDNLSTGIIIAGITVAMIFIAHPKTIPFIAAGGGVLAIVIGFVIYISKHINDSGSFRIMRIIVWLQPEKFSKEGGYQTMQALYAIGSGGFFGKGLGNSAQKLGAVPEAQNDMIFSIICEELGVFGAALLTVLFIFLLYRLLFIAQNAPDLFGSLMVTGIFAHIALQVILNIAVVTNSIPNTGITLPFISYGGTSVVFLMGEMALALSVSKQIKFKEKEG